MMNINELVQVISFAYCRIIFWSCICQQHHSAAKLANTVLNYLNRSTIYWAQKAILLTCLALLSPQVVRVILCTAYLENCGPKAKKTIELKREMQGRPEKMDGFYEGRHAMELQARMGTASTTHTRL